MLTLARTIIVNSLYAKQKHIRCYAKEQKHISVEILNKKKKCCNLHLFSEINLASCLIHEIVSIISPHKQTNIFIGKEALCSFDFTVARRFSILNIAVDFPRFSAARGYVK